MKLNKSDLKKIIYDFNSISNRLLQAQFEDYLDVLTKYITFLNNTELIQMYIASCGVCTQNMDEAFKAVRSSHGQAIFDLGATDKEEVSNVYAIIKYIVDNKIQVYYNIAMNYSHSNKYQDALSDFNKRVVMVLIHHIERYLTKVGIDMGLDEKVNYTISVQNGQVNIANDNATINATNNIGINGDDLSKLIQAVKDNAHDLSEEDRDTLECNLDVIEEEIKAEQPRKKFLKTAINGIKMLTGSTTFISAVTALVEAVQELIS